MSVHLCGHHENAQSDLMGLRAENKIQDVSNTKQAWTPSGRLQRSAQQCLTARLFATTMLDLAEFSFAWSSLAVGANVEELEAYFWIVQSCFLGRVSVKSKRM
jgi:hypothetical protein